MVEFTTGDGRTVTFISGVGFGHRPEIGGEVPVRYRSKDPEQAEIDRAYIWMLPAAIWLVVGAGLLVAAVVVFTDDPQAAPAAEEPQVMPTVVDSPQASGTGEPVPVGPPPAKVATGRIGDTLTAVDATGTGQLRLTVTRLRYSTGAQGDPPPEHGLYVAMHVRARALADGQLLRIEALVSGRPYDQYTEVSSAAFQPLLANVNFSLDEGDVAVGWVVFDVPDGTASWYCATPTCTRLRSGPTDLQRCHHGRDPPGASFGRPAAAHLVNQAIAGPSGHKPI